MLLQALSCARLRMSLAYSSLFEPLSIKYMPRSSFVKVSIVVYLFCASRSVFVAASERIGSFGVVVDIVSLNNPCH